jgi:hypothetical protein
LRLRAERASCGPQEFSLSDTIKRAFELARSGECQSIQELKKRLSSERHSAVEQHLAGLSIRKQLNGIIAERRQSQGGDGLN